MARETITDVEYHSGVKGSSIMTTTIEGLEGYVFVPSSDYAEDYSYPENERAYNHPTKGRLK